MKLSEFLHEDSKIIISHELLQDLYAGTTSFSDEELNTLLNEDFIKKAGEFILTYNDAFKS